MTLDKQERKELDTLVDEMIDIRSDLGTAVRVYGRVYDVLNNINLDKWERADAKSLDSIIEVIGKHRYDASQSAFDQLKHVDKLRKALELFIKAAR